MTCAVHPTVCLCCVSSNFWGMKILQKTVKLDLCIHIYSREDYRHSWILCKTITIGNTNQLMMHKMFKILFSQKQIWCCKNCENLIPQKFLTRVVCDCRYHDQVYIISQFWAGRGYWCRNQEPATPTWWGVIHVNTVHQLVWQVACRHWLLQLGLLQCLPCS